MSDLICENENNDDVDVIVEGRGGGVPVSFQLYQDIYNQITGRTEQLVKQYKNSIKLDFSDIEQLDIKIKQILEQWKIISINASYVIYFNKNQKESFSSIERFRSYNCSSSSFSESVAIKYSFSMAIPSTNRVQNYVINVQLNSRIVAQQRLMSEIPFNAPPAFVNLLVAKTAEIRVDFVDYVIARTILTAFDEWVDSLRESKSNIYVNFAKSKSHYIPIILKFITLTVILYFIQEKIPVYIKDQSSSLQPFAYFSFFSGTVVFFGYKISSYFGSYVEHSLDSTTEISYLKLTKGDEKNIDDSVQKNGNQFRNAVIGLIANFALNLLVRYIATKF